MVVVDAVSATVRSWIERHIAPSREPRIPHDDTIADTMRSWINQQISPWCGREISRHAAYAYFNDLNSTNPEVFIFDIAHGKVSVSQKFFDGTGPGPADAKYRAGIYRKFLEQVAQNHHPNMNTRIAMFVGDGAYERPKFPMFSFQKKIGNPSLLLPDIDLINPDFLANPSFADPVPHQAKSVSAIFAGSTTGGMVTVDAVRARSLPRLRAAFYFQGREDVHFHLPAIVQCDSQEAADLLRAAGFGGGERYSWQEQFHHRFLISMDGNGPSPARLSVGMRSNSVVMHYKSPHVLHYFSGLQPWLHFLPIDADSDVVHLINEERRRPGAFEYICTHGRQFVEDYLEPKSVNHYTADLLRDYETLLNGLRCD